LSGTLYVVSTPIGNLADLSSRARDTLATADVVACEDTRRTGRLLSRLGLAKKLVSVHEHNESRRLPGLLAELEGGRDVALVSDAGTPLLSDPGYVMVRGALDRGLPVVPIPGANAPLAALVVSGLPPYPFTFAGFPPPKGAKRRRFLTGLSGLDHTLILFESPHRLLRTLADLVEILGDRPAAVARELTKMHEETLRGTLPELLQMLSGRPALKGEFCIVVGAGGTKASPRRFTPAPDPESPDC
jgi:16S rRNA (cytidine1402-2'-O)-methyltransferase